MWLFVNKRHLGRNRYRTGDCGDGIDGVPNGDVCCSSTCTEGCGGVGCSNFTGGKTDCCMNTIREAAVACSASLGVGGPCILSDDGGGEAEFDFSDFAWLCFVVVGKVTAARGISTGCQDMTLTPMAWPRAC